jgi:hypothetical protein
MLHVTLLFGLQVSLISFPNAFSYAMGKVKGKGSIMFFPENEGRLVSCEVVDQNQPALQLEPSVLFAGFFSFVPKSFG